MEENQISDVSDIGPGNFEGAAAASEKNEEAPAKPNPERLKQLRNKMAENLSRRDKRCGVSFKADLKTGVMFKVFQEKESVDLVKAKLEKDYPHLFENPEDAEQTHYCWTDQQIEKMDRFDWRSLGVTPFVRVQKGDTCWANAATAAFESSLMIQCAKAGIVKRKNEKLGWEGVVGKYHTQAGLEYEGEATRDKITLNVYRPVHAVRASKKQGLILGDWHENALKYFYRGVRLNDMAFFRDEDNLILDYDSLDEEDATFDLNEDQTRYEEELNPQRVRAVAWGYVHENLEMVYEVPEPREIKRALLEHGPLVAGIAVGDGFEKWGINDEQADTNSVFQGKEHQPLANHVVLIVGWDDMKKNSQSDHGAWIVQNSWKNWGYQCDGPRVMESRFRSTDRGFAYIQYGSNDIGRFATWIEADLLTETQEKILRNNGAVVKSDGLVPETLREIERQITEVLGGN